MNSEYFKLDVNIGDHAKMVDLSDTAFRLYILSIGYANRHLTDGFIATAVARRLVEHDPHGLGWDWTDHADALVVHRLWEKVDGGYVIHDFGDHNTLRDERLRKRREDADRKAAWRAAQRGTTRGTAAPTARPPRKPPAQPGPTGQDNGVPQDTAAVSHDGPASQGAAVPSTRARGSARGDSGKDRDNDSDSGTATAVAVTDVSDGTRADARFADHPQPPTAKQLTAEHIGRCKARPPKAIADRTGREVAKLLAEGISPDRIRAGLELLRTRAKHPSLLPALVHEAANPPQPRGAAEHVTPPAAPRCEHGQHARLCDVCHPKPAAPGPIPDWRAALRPSPADTPADAGVPP